MGLALAAALPAAAHPHIFIDAAVTVAFDESGRLARLRHEWRFDPLFSAWMVQGLDTDGDGVVSSAEMQELADENMLGLAEYGFYTYASVAGRDLHFSAFGDQSMRHDPDGRVVLDFSVVPETPVPLPAPLELAVNDPEYYVAITFADPGTVRLADAPASCAVELVPPQPMAPEIEERLYALGPEVLELPPDLAAAMRGTQGMILLDCPGVAAPETAAEAAAGLAQSRPIPFGGPPPEPGLPLPRDGVFGWLQEQQRSFYAAMTGALDALREDWTAFWLLGGLSFLYGVLHAAGPGHGKVVIGSYVLASRTELRRGVALSFASALLQALVAIGFVLVAAGVLRLGSVAMGTAADWIGIVSYGLVAALGLWLVLRKLLGLGHSHHHPPDDMRRKAHAHLHGTQAQDHHAHHHHHGHDHDHHHHHDHDHDGHHHVVTPEATRRPWREQLGVVLAVGLRPCSGALVVLVFALSQGLLPAGIVATLLMGLGTGITVAALASLAVGAKGLAARLGGLDSPAAARIVWGLELAGAFAVLAFGLLLLGAAL